MVAITVCRGCRINVSACASTAARCPCRIFRGLFRERLVAEAWQCHEINDGISINEAAFAEPFAVTLHAVARAGSLLGSAFLSPAAVRLARSRSSPRGCMVHGRSWRLTMDAVLKKAEQVGADRTINVASNAEQLAGYAANKGYFDVHFEASGNERAIRSGLEVLKPRGVLVQLGLGGDISIPQNMVVAKEIEVRGTFRFHEEFGLAVNLINRRAVDFKPLLTGCFGLADVTNGL